MSRRQPAGGSLAEQFAALGLVSPKTLQEHLAEVQLSREDQEHRSRKAAQNPDTGVTLDDLRRAKTIGDFRRVAKQLLAEDDRHISAVIREAHRFKDEEADKDPGKRIVWQMYQVREGLCAISPEKRGRFLDRAFRSANQKFNTDF